MEGRATGGGAPARPNECRCAAFNSRDYSHTFLFMCMFVFSIYYYLSMCSCVSMRVGRCAGLTLEINGVKNSSQ